MIKLTDNIHFNPALPFWRQTPEAQEYLQEIMDMEPATEQKELCKGGCERTVSQTWTTEKGALTVETTFVFPASSNEFGAIKNTVFKVEGDVA